MNIGIIGCGVVGQSVHNSLEAHKISIYDPAKGYGVFGSVLDTEALFICLPTPSGERGQDISLITLTLDRLEKAEYKGLVIIKSTVTPKNLKLCLNNYENLSLCHAPEFLNQFEPYFETNKHLIGVKNIYQSHLYKKIFSLEGYGKHEIRTTDPITASMVKFTHNLHGVSKVIFFHVINEICELEGVNYREMLGALLSQNNNVGQTYTKIAADGQKGFGGKCFPDNLDAFISDYDFNIFRAYKDDNSVWRSDGRRCSC